MYDPIAGERNLHSPSLLLTGKFVEWEKNRTGNKILAPDIVQSFWIFLEIFRTYLFVFWEPRYSNNGEILKRCFWTLIQMKKNLNAHSYLKSFVHSFFLLRIQTDISPNTLHSNISLVSFSADLAMIYLTFHGGVTVWTSRALLLPQMWRRG